MVKSKRNNLQKSTQKKPQKNSFVLSIYRFIKENGRLPKKAYTSTSFSATTYQARKLMSLGIIKKVGSGSGVYKILVDEKEAIRRLNSNTKKKFVTTKTIPTNMQRKYKRIHSIQCRLTLPKFDFWYNILQKYLDKKQIPYDINKKNQFKLTLMHENLKHTFLLCKDCIIFYLPTGREFISDDVDFGMDLVKVYCSELLGVFSNYFGKDLRVKGEFRFTITRRHIAMMNNQIAKKMRKNKSYIRVWVDGKLRLISDNSFNFDELEAISNKNAISDVKRVELFLADVITNGETISDIKTLINNENMSMLKTIRDMQEVVKKQNEMISMITKNSGFSVGDFTK